MKSPKPQPEDYASESDYRNALAWWEVEPTEEPEIPVELAAQVLINEVRKLGYTVIAMKKQSFVMFLLWACVMLLTFFGLVVSLFAQEQDSTRQESPCVCDSAFVRRTNARIERQFDVNDMIFRSLKDHAHAYLLLKHRFDSLVITTEQRNKPQVRRKK